MKQVYGPLTVYSVKYFHRISPSPKDVGPDVTLSVAQKATRLTLGRALREADVLFSGVSLREVRTNPDGSI